MNERFVCIKVDREERPDVDAIYMDAVQAMTGQGGWPLNAFLTPDGRAVLRRHLLPARAAPGHAVVAAGPDRLGDAWLEQREEIEETGRADPAAAGGRGALEPSEDELDPAALDAAVAALRSGYDAEHGGFHRGGPKFPPSSAIEFLLGRGEREMALHTLRAMAGGAMYDQIGGGFARYSVDARWEIPHFEKMLYDNALLARVYLHGFQVSGEPLFARVCTETLDWVLRDLRQDGGRLRVVARRRLRGRRGQVLRLDAGRDARRARRDDCRARARATSASTGAPNFEGAWAPVRAASDPERLARVKARAAGGARAARAGRRSTTSA